MPLSAILVFFGGGIGSLLRYLIGVAALCLPGQPVLGFPWRTLAINVIGSFLIGLVVGLLAGVSARQNLPVSATWQLFLATGVLGGFTTFSTFALKAVQLAQRGHFTAAATYILTSTLLRLTSVMFA